MIKAYVHPNEVFKMIVHTDGNSGKRVDRFEEILASPGLASLTTYIKDLSEYVEVTLLCVFLQHYGEEDLTRLLASSMITCDRPDTKLMQRFFFKKFGLEDETISEVAEMLKASPYVGVPPGLSISWLTYIAILATECHEEQTAIVKHLIEMYPDRRYIMLIRCLEKEYLTASGQIAAKGVRDLERRRRHVHNHS